MKETKTHYIALKDILDDIDKRVPDIKNISDEICLFDYDMTTICKLDDSAPLIWLYNRELKSEQGGIVCHNYDYTKDIEITTVWYDGEKSLLVINRKQLVVLNIKNYYKIRDILMYMNFNNLMEDHIRNQLCTLDDAFITNREHNATYESLKIVSNENGKRRIIVDEDANPWSSDINIPFHELMEMDEVVTLTPDKWGKELIDEFITRHDYDNDPYVTMNYEPEVMDYNIKFNDGYTATQYVHDPSNILEPGDLMQIWVIKKKDTPICCIFLSEYLIDTYTNKAIFDYDMYNELYYKLLQYNKKFKPLSVDECYENIGDDGYIKICINREME